MLLCGRTPPKASNRAAGCIMLRTFTAARSPGCLSTRVLSNTACPFPALFTSTHGVCVPLASPHGPAPAAATVVSDAAGPARGRARHGSRMHDRPPVHEHRLSQGAPRPPTSHQQQLPSLGPQPEHRRIPEPQLRHAGCSQGDPARHGPPVPPRAAGRPQVTVGEHPVAAKRLLPTSRPGPHRPQVC